MNNTKNEQERQKAEDLAREQLAVLRERFGLPERQTSASCSHQGDGNYAACILIGLHWQSVVMVGPVGAGKWRGYVSSPTENLRRWTEGMYDDPVECFLAVCEDASGHFAEKIKNLNGDVQCMGRILAGERERQRLGS